MDRARIDVLATPRDHFRLNFYASVYHLVDHLRRNGRTLDAAFSRYPFLAAYFEASASLLPDGLSWDDTREWWQREILAWEDGPEAPHLPLRALRASGGVDFPARMALVTAGLVEEDSRFGAIFAELEGGSRTTRPSLETVAAIVAPPGSEDAAAAWSLGRVLFAGGLVDIPNRAAPRSEWVLHVTPEIWELIRGEEHPTLPSWAHYRPVAELAALSELVVPEAFAARLDKVAPLLADGRAAAVVLRGRRGAERREVIDAIAADLGMGTVAVAAAAMPDAAWPRLGPLCTALGAMPVLTYDLAPGDTAEVPALAAYTGPVGLVIGAEGGLQGEVLEHSVPLELPPVRAADRLRRWKVAFAGHPVDDILAIAERFHLPGRHLARAARSAMTIAALDGRDAVTLADVQAACGTLNRQLLDTLAARLEPEGTWDQLVVGDVTYAKLAELEARCRHRETVLDSLGPGFGAHMNSGVRALFTGSSGTGKTLAAKILGAELGMDVYRVDLAAVVNKYVGETEKNLHRVLSTAEELDVLLLIDEGDALLGSRTEVRSANDRFANLETNYLLQRLETYQGIVVVTTNASENIDPAFQRRMDVVVSFVEPAPRERWEIWQMHLPADHAVDGGFLEDVAVRSVMTGGQIRNAALHATLLAVDDGGIVRRSHVEAAVAGEYQKAGALSPFDPSGRRTPSSRARAFLEALP